MRKTKIICTLGPSTDNDQILREMMLEGMNVARINFSHGTHKDHLIKINKVKQLREELNLPVAILLDTKGPEIRVKTFEKDKVKLTIGQHFVLTTKDVVGTDGMVSVTYKDLPKDVEVGSTILLDDGLIELTVKKISATDIECIVMNDGVISNNKGVNLPGAEVSMPFISEKDRSDIIFGIENDVDFIAASFSRNADDILEIRKIFQEYNCDNIQIIAKIENMQGVNNIEEITRVSDGVMVARGDMGVEIPLEDVPVLQKKIIKAVSCDGKPVITATQMLDSMMKNPRPTRAEATDVANAIYDGTSAIMLSGETAAGLYPIESLKTMVKIALRTEQDIDYVNRFRDRITEDNQDVTTAISRATCNTAIDLNASAIITVTLSGRTARMISKYRPPVQIIGCSTDSRICRRLNLSWGVTPLLMGIENATEDLFDHAVNCAEEAKLISAGEMAVLTGGVPLGTAGTTNLIKVQVAGHILLTGKGLSDKKISGDLCVCETADELSAKFKDGDILVLKESNNEILPFIKLARGLIVEKGGSNSHAAVVGMALELPVILEAENATKILKHGCVVTLDAARGVVSRNDETVDQ